METKTTVIVTGFGPFGVHRINSSWQAVKELPNIGFDENINLVIREIPVEYKTVSNVVPKLWKDFKPKLCIHVGVCPLINVMKLEKCAHNSDYKGIDISNKCPNMECCVPGGCECMVTNIDMEKICREANEDNCPCALETSCDAGRYLCEFIYYTSLTESLKVEHKGSSVAFVHVPTLDNPYSKTQLAQSLKYLVLEMLKEENIQHRCGEQLHDHQ